MDGKKGRKKVKAGKERKEWKETGRVKGNKEKKIGREEKKETVEERKKRMGGKKKGRQGSKKATEGIEGR